MKRFFTVKLGVILVVLLMTSTLSYGQVIVAWQFTLPEPSKGREVSQVATTLDDNLKEVILTRGGGARKTQGNARGFGANLVACSNYEEAKVAGAFYQFDIQAKKGHKVSIHSIASIMRRQEQAANTYRWTYSLDGKNFIELGDEPTRFETFKNGGDRQPRLHTKKVEELQNIPSSQKVIIRLYAWGGETNIGNKINFGIGKSGSKANNALAIFGTVEKE